MASTSVSPPNASQPFRFLELPAELRNMIYELALVPPQVNLRLPVVCSRVYFTTNERPANVNLLRVSRKVNEEGAGYWRTHCRSTPLVIQVCLGSPSNYPHFFNSLYLVQSLIEWLGGVYELHREAIKKGHRRKYLTNPSAALRFTHEAYPRYRQDIMTVQEMFQLLPITASSIYRPLYYWIALWQLGQPNINKFVRNIRIFGRLYRAMVHQLTSSRQIDIKICATHLVQQHEGLLSFPLSGLVVVGCDWLFDRMWVGDTIFRNPARNIVPRINIKLVTARGAAGRIHNLIAPTMAASTLRGNITWVIDEADLCDWSRWSEQIP